MSWEKWRGGRKPQKRTRQAGWIVKHVSNACKGLPRATTGNKGPGKGRTREEGLFRPSPPLRGRPPHGAQVTSDLNRCRILGRTGPLLAKAKCDEVGTGLAPFMNQQRSIQRLWRLGTPGAALGVEPRISAVASSTEGELWRETKQPAEMPYVPPRSVQ